MNSHIAELVPLGGLKPHPRNYRDHPEVQLAHIRASIEEHGFYRNVVTARDGTVLAGHGVVEVCRALGVEEVPAVRLPIDPDSPQAIKVLTGDNSIGGLAYDDAQELSNILQELMDAGDLLGTGYDEEMVESMTALSESFDGVAPADFSEFGDEDIEMKHTCPKCGYEWR